MLRAKPNTDTTRVSSREALLDFKRPNAKHDDVLDVALSRKEGPKPDNSRKHYPKRQTPLGSIIFEARLKRKWDRKNADPSRGSRLGDGLL